MTLSIGALQRLSRFLIDGHHRHSQWLHDHGKPSGAENKTNFLQRRGKGIDKLSRLESFAGMLTVPRELPLNILIVENNIADYSVYEKLEFTPNPLWKHLDKANWYIVHQEYESWEPLLRGLKQQERDAQKITANKLEWKDIKEEIKDEKEEIKCSQIDLILQDIFLDSQTDIPLGYQLTTHYFDLMPQALVFLLTSMDIEHLAATGITHRADAVLSKTRMGSVWWYYYQAFIRLFGHIFWQPWCTAAENDSSISCRNTLRGLFGCLRRWQLEPEILWHGQNLPEMIDHGNQHISGLWRLADDIMAEAIEISPDFARRFNPEQRILLTLGIWLHDIGHRGDALHIDPIAIRNSHGAISERLLLEDPAAFGLEWLLELCKHKESQCGCGCNAEGRKQNRNKISESSNDLCLLRKVGLLCRSHQSSAPLWSDKLAEGYQDLKFPNPYTRLGYDGVNVQNIASNQAVKTWLDPNCDLDWAGSDIRCLEDYNDKTLVPIACLLRWLDALDISRWRTGSRARQTTHRLFLQERKKWCRRRLKELAVILGASPPGSKAYIKTIDEQAGLLGYCNLLDVQDIHLWRHSAVDRIRIGHDMEGGKWLITITYDIYPDNPPELILQPLKDQQAKIEDKWHIVLDNKKKKYCLWAAHMLDDVILPEINSQRWGEEVVVDRFFGNNLEVRIYAAPVGDDEMRMLLWPLKEKR